MKIKNIYTWIQNPEVLIFIILFILSVLIRIPFLKYQSWDYLNYLNPWVTFIRSHGGILSLRYNFFNYNPPYLYALALGSYLPIPSIYLIKGISIIFDFIIALYTFKIVGERFENKFVPALASVIVLFIPTVLINSALWGQADSIFTAFLLIFVYALLKGKNTQAMIMIAISFAIKPQAFFLLPVVLILFLLKRVNIKQILWIPFIFIISIIPALLLGKPIMDILSVYPANSLTGNYLSLNAANFYTWMPSAYRDFFGTSGQILTLAIVLIIVLVYIKYAKDKFTNIQLIGTSLLFSLVIPFFFPRTHERYFFISDVLSISYAFYNPKMFIIPIIVQIASMFSYYAGLDSQTQSFLPLFSGFILIAIVITGAYEIYYLINKKDR